MEYLEVSQIHQAKNNPKTIRDAKFQQLVKSVRQFPEMLEKRPLVVYHDEEGVVRILGGNQRFKAAKEVGMTQIPVVWADDWTQAQRDEFMIKDNVISGEWDWDMLKIDWDGKELKDWGVKTNFDTIALPDEEPQPKKKLRGIIIDFQHADYDAAAALIKHFKDKGTYIGQILIDALREQKNV